MKSFNDYLEESGEVGYITSLSQSIILVSGLPFLRLGEMIVTEGEEKGLVYGLQENLAEVLMFETKNLKVGQRVTRTQSMFTLGIGKGVLGRVLNPILQPIDNLGPIVGEKEYFPIEKEAPNIIQRVRINKPLETGVMVVDFLVPLGYGQRELVVGDEKTGKTTFLLRAISHQTKKGVICIYTCIGKKISDVKEIEENLKRSGAFYKTSLIVALPNLPAPLIFLAPFTGITVAEYFRDKGENVILVLDDMTTHAKVYREISLLLKRSPGRDAYPGDIFHIHAQIMERAGNIRVGNKEMSITAFPVADTLENDITGFIQTNLIAMTDGHIFFDIEEFRKGRRPAINPFLSVSRVGKQTRTPLEQFLGSWLQRKLGDYKRALEIIQFGVELPKATKETIDLGEKIELVLNQEPEISLSRSFQMFLIGLLRSKFWKEKKLEEVKNDLEKIIDVYKRGGFSTIERSIEELKNQKEFDEFIERKIPLLKEILYAFTKKS
jgi:F-type H+-transporting ATPase subunit alpha